MTKININGHDPEWASAARFGESEISDIMDARLNGFSVPGKTKKCKLDDFMAGEVKAAYSQARGFFGAALRANDEYISSMRIKVKVSCKTYGFKLSVSEFGVARSVPFVVPCNL